jgi:hypothetical protein
LLLPLLTRSETFCIPSWSSHSSLFARFGILCLWLSHTGSSRASSASSYGPTILLNFISLKLISTQRRGVLGPATGAQQQPVSRRAPRPALSSSNPQAHLRWRGAEARSRTPGAEAGARERTSPSGWWGQVGRDDSRGALLRGSRKAHRSRSRPGESTSASLARRPVTTEIPAAGIDVGTAAQRRRGRPRATHRRHLRRTVQRGVRKGEGKVAVAAASRTGRGPSHSSIYPAGERAVCGSGVELYRVLAVARRSGAWQRLWRANRRARRRGFAGPRSWRGTCRAVSAKILPNGGLGVPQSPKSTHSFLFPCQSSQRLFHHFIAIR